MNSPWVFCRRIHQTPNSQTHVATQRLSLPSPHTCQSSRSAVPGLCPRCPCPRLLHLRPLMPTKLPSRSPPPSVLRTSRGPLSLLHIKARARVQVSRPLEPVEDKHSWTSVKADSAQCCPRREEPASGSARSRRLRGGGKGQQTAPGPVPGLRWGCV